jgi:hypothetical protein
MGVDGRNGQAGPAALQDAVTRVEAFGRNPDVACWDPDDLVAGLEAVARGVKILEACRTMLAGRVATCGAHRARGELSAAHMLAATSGSSLREAKEAIAVARRLDGQPELDAAFRAGAISVEQATAISDAAAADPAAERELLALAGEESRRVLRDRARAVKVKAEDDRDGRYQRQRNTMSLRHWIDDTGMGCGAWRLPPDVDAALMARIQPEDRSHLPTSQEGRSSPPAPTPIPSGRAWS